jgi:DNA recombination protein RmuC
VAYSWKQEGLSKNAQEIAKLGAELYDRLGTACEHLSKVGRNLTTAVQAHNQLVVSIDTRVLVSARKLKECAGISQELPSLQQIDQIARS